MRPLTVEADDCPPILTTAAAVLFAEIVREWMAASTTSDSEQESAA